MAAMMVKEMMMTYKTKAEWEAAAQKLRIEYPFGMIEGDPVDLEAGWAAMESRKQTDARGCSYFEYGGRRWMTFPVPGHSGFWSIKEGPPKLTLI
jgi:hypothetical protein